MAPSQTYIRKLSKPQQQRQRERHKTKGLMSRTIAMQLHYKSLYISFLQNNNVTYMTKWKDANDVGDYATDL